MIPVIFGPTGVGKTEILLQIAQHLPIEVISMDSMQIYRQMDIGTAKPSSQEQKILPHHMIDIVWPDQPFDAYTYLQMTTPLIDQIIERGRMPVIAGGTGLYLDALLYGITEGIPRDLKIRKTLQEQEDQAPGSLYTRLGQIDPQSAGRIHSNDMRRIIRALEVHQITGKPWSELRQRNEPDPRYRIFFLSRDRADLYRRIDQRVDAMLDKGLMEETRGLVEQYGNHHQSMKAIGYSHCIQYMDTPPEALTEMKTLMKRDTRHYARRQIIWGRRYDHAHIIDLDRELIAQIMNRFEIIALHNT